MVPPVALEPLWMRASTMLAQVCGGELPSAPVVEADWGADELEEEEG